MKWLAFFIIWIGSLSWIYAQQIELKGQVSIHNSKYKTGHIQYVHDAYITASFTKPANSDDTGKFQLQFVEMDPGTAVELQAEKSGLEVVNIHDLKNVIIGRKPPVRVYLAKIGSLVSAQTEYYNISKDALYARKNALIVRLRNDNEESEEALKELSIYFQEKIEDRTIAEEKLNQRILKLEKQLPEFSRDLARQNLDFASEFYIRAYEHFQAGEIENALKVLDSANTKSLKIKAWENIKEGERLKSIGEDLVVLGNQQLEQVEQMDSLRAKLERINLSVEPIYFDFDRFNINPNGEAELSKLLQLLKGYPSLTLRIESHTSSRGSEAYNEQLSMKMAQTTLNWLIARGIEPNRMSAIGYGESQLTNHCSNGIECTEEEHRQNRRTIFILE